MKGRLSPKGGGRRYALAIAATFATALSLVSLPGVASAQGAQWSVSAVSRPTNLHPGGDSGGDAFVVLLTNTGAAPNTTLNEKGEEVPVPVTITDELPEGLSPAAGATGEDELLVKGQGTTGGNFSRSCTVDGEEHKVSCTYDGVVQPDDTLELTFPVTVAATPPDTCAAPLQAGAVSCVGNVVRVSGGGAAAASMGTEAMVSELPASFGIAPGGSSTALSSVQAGAHADLTVTTAFDTESSTGRTAGNLKDTIYDLPAGFAGDFVDTPACQGAAFLEVECPVASQVGVTTIVIDLEGVPHTELQPVYNLAPEPGKVAKLGFKAGPFFYEGDISVIAPGGGGEPYAAQTVFYNATAGAIAVDNVSLTIWGVPASPAHNPLRFHSLKAGLGEFGTPPGGLEAPYLSNPTACGAGQLQASFAVTSWQHPGEGPPATAMPFGPVVGCDRLGMAPSLSAEVTSSAASAPTGFDLQTLIPQTYENPAGLATSTLKKEVVTLPEGMTVNPSAGAGLAACSEAQYAEEAAQVLPGHGCPNQSRLATVKISSPSLKEEVTGSVFLAQPAPFGEPGHNPFNSLLSLYLIARASNRGVLVKTAGLVQANEATGQLTTTFDDLPPLPFSIATFRFNQGANAPLVTPPACGNYTVTAQLTPYSDPEGTPLAPLVPSFPIFTSCPAGGTPPFSPQVTAGTQSNAAGSYSPLYLKLTRQDGEQEITGFSSQMPPGLTANLNGVAECGEAEIAAAKAQTGAQAEEHPACPSGSEIGHTIAEAGVGSVLAQAPGKLYLGAPYQGAPFSIVSVTAAKVGPFDLGTVVVHLPLFINPETASVTVGSGSANQIPHIIKGIVIHVRNIRVYVSRANFTENPTSCAPMAFGATVIGGGADPTNPADNTPATVNDPFQAADCANLKFEPKISVSTSGKTSKSQGASLTYKIAYPNVPQGTDADIHYVKVELPGELPSRLTTLQKACTQGTFKVNPADCPKESVIGHAKAVVPNIPVPLEGPVYFVSNGGEAFPNLVMVLQGYGVTIDLIGDTLIKNGVTSTTFNQVPDNPLTSFEINLPEGPYSALAANGNLCKPTVTKTVKKKVRVQVNGRMRTVTRKVKEQVSTSLTIPSDYVGQNGAVYKVNAPIAVTGCPKAKVAKKKAKRKAKRKAHKK